VAGLTGRYEQADPKTRLVRLPVPAGLADVAEQVRQVQQQKTAAFEKGDLESTGRCGAGPAQELTGDRADAGLGLLTLLATERHVGPSWRRDRSAGARAAAGIVLAASGSSRRGGWAECADRRVELPGHFQVDLDGVGDQADDDLAAAMDTTPSHLYGSDQSAVSERLELEPAGLSGT
jgi:hypothetical protein